MTLEEQPEVPPPDESPTVVAATGHKDYNIPAVINEDDKFRWCWDDAPSASKSAFGRAIGVSWSNEFTKEQLIKDLLQDKYSNDREVRIMRIGGEGKPEAIKIYLNREAVIAGQSTFNEGWFMKASQ